MTDNTYNGWANYATWRINREIFDGMDIDDIGWRGMDRFDLAPVLREYAEEIIEMTAPEGLARDYAMAFISHVDYREIADMLIGQNEEV